MNSLSITPSVRHICGQSIANRPRRQRCHAFVALWLLVVVLVAAVPSHANAQDDPSQLSAEGERAALLINQQRADVGLPPLSVHPLLTMAANLHIQDMISSGVWGHYSSDGSSVRTRIARTGYVTNGWSGENWAVAVTVDKSVGWWMTDAPHRENVLNRAYTEMGIGTAPHPQGWGLILVVDFSTGNVNGVEGSVAERGETSAVVDAVAPQAIVTAPIADSGLRYTILPGDTLSSIGQRYGVDWQSIAQLNSLGDGTILQIGTQLRIPGRGEPQTAVAQSEKGVYTVAAGDTLLGIALRFGLEWQTLAVANELTEHSILQIGDVLTIPSNTVLGDTKTTAAESVNAARTHTVQAGETVWVIAARYGVDWRAILQKNGLGEQSLLRIGQVLALP